MNEKVNMKLGSTVKGRPRSLEARRAIITAFTESVRQQGYNKVSIDGVAKAAGVGRSTIYRWYKDKSEIALDAATDYSLQSLHYPLTGDFEADFCVFLQHTFAIGNELGTMYTVLMAEAQANPEFAKRVWDKYSSQRREQLEAILKQKGAWPESLSATFLLDLIFGAIWYRLMSGHAPLDNTFADELLTSVTCLLSV